MPERNTNSFIPAENIGRQNLPAFPYGENQFRPAVLYVAIVEDGEIVGYLPASVTDNGDGTCSLDSTSS